MIPTPKTYVRKLFYFLSTFSISNCDSVLKPTSGSVLSHIGLNGGAVGQPHISTPYHGHALIQVSLFSPFFRLTLSSSLPTLITFLRSCVLIF